MTIHVPLRRKDSVFLLIDMDNNTTIAVFSSREQAAMFLDRNKADYAGSVVETFEYQINPESEKNACIG